MVLSGWAAILVATQGAAQEARAIDLSNTRGAWTKVCRMSKGSQICYTTADFGQGASNTLALAIYDIVGKPRILRAMVPLGVLEDHGILASAGGRRIARLRFQTCTQKACFAAATISNAVLRTFARGGELQLTMTNAFGRNVTFNLPLAGFQPAFEGAGISQAEAGQIGASQ